MYLNSFKKSKTTIWAGYFRPWDFCTKTSKPIYLYTNKNKKQKLVTCCYCPRHTHCQLARNNIHSFHSLLVTAVLFFSSSWQKVTSSSKLSTPISTYKKQEGWRNRVWGETADFVLFLISPGHLPRILFWASLIFGATTINHFSAKKKKKVSVYMKLDLKRWYKQILK